VRKTKKKELALALKVEGATSDTHTKFNTPGLIPRGKAISCSEILLRSIHPTNYLNHH
jgi:hypothetical protein